MQLGCPENTLRVLLRTKAITAAPEAVDYCCRSPTLNTMYTFLASLSITNDYQDTGIYKN